jgi:hypothetical protein
LNGVLGYISPIKNHSKETIYLFDKQPNKVVKEHNVFYRPHLDQFLNSLFVKVKKIYLEKNIF